MYDQGDTIQKVNEKTERKRIGDVIRGDYVNADGFPVIDVIWRDMPHRGAVEQRIHPPAPYVVKPIS